MKLEGKKIAVLVADEYEDLELWYPILRMKEEGAEVMVVASDNVEKDTCYSKHGYEVDIDKKAAEVDPSSFDAVIIPGGWAPDKIRRCQNTLNLIREMNEDGKVIASICHGGWVLSSADIIEGKTVTSTVGIKDDLEHAGAHWIDNEVVIDGNLITSRAPADLPEFSKAIIFALSNKVCVVCGTKHEDIKEGAFYCVNCQTYYCPECAEENDLRMNSHEKLKRKKQVERKRSKKLESTSSLDEYKRNICPECGSMMGLY
ncbi:MAG: DJ-1/PfpI/YhbO family deglycase/protease [Bacillota bacterium]